MPASGEWMRLGQLTAPRGLRGEIKIQLDADPAVAGGVTRVYLGDERRPYDVRGFFQRGRAYALKLHGVRDMTAAEGLRGAMVFVRRSELPPLPAGHYFVEDVVGLRAVTTDGREIGTVDDVISTGANDVYVVHGDGRETLIPAIRSVVVDVDVAAGVVRVEPMPGLLRE